MGKIGLEYSECNNLIKKVKKCEDNIEKERKAVEKAISEINDISSGYSELNNIVSKSKLSLNITPNFNFSCHDRIINSIALGSCPLTDYNNYLGSKFKDLESIVFYNYKDIYSLDNKISKIIDNKNYIDILNKSNRILKENFTWNKTIEKLRIFFNSKIS